MNDDFYAGLYQLIKSLLYLYASKERDEYLLRSFLAILEEVSKPSLSTRKSVEMLRKEASRSSGAHAPQAGDLAVLIHLVIL